MSDTVTVKKIATEALADQAETYRLCVRTPLTADEGLCYRISIS
jgi:hypothetical protein